METGPRSFVLALSREPFPRVLYKAPGVLLVSLELDGRAFSPADVPHDHGVVGAAREQHPLDGVPAERRHPT